MRSRLGMLRTEGQAVEAPLNLWLTTGKCELLCGAGAIEWQALHYPEVDNMGETCTKETTSEFTSE